MPNQHNYMKNTILLSIFCLFIFNARVGLAQTAYNPVIASLAQKWAAAESAKDTAAMSKLFARQATFYGKKLKRPECMRLKANIYRKYADYNVTIAGPVLLTDKGEGMVQSSFLKQVIYGGKTKKFEAYLTWQGKGDNWQIIEESDKTTDSNLVKMQDIKEHTVKGDFNGDGKQETATLVLPQIDGEAMECEGGCDSRITFSDHAIPDIVITNCIGGTPVNHGDLNDNNTYEIGINPWWFMGCWRPYLVYTLINGKWDYAVKPFSTYCDQWEQGYAPIVKDKNKKGYAIITYTEQPESPDEFKVKHKSVLVKR